MLPMTKAFFCFWQQFAIVLSAASASRDGRLGTEECQEGIYPSSFFEIFHFILVRKYLGGVFLFVCFRFFVGWGRGSVGTGEGLVLPVYSKQCSY